MDIALNPGERGLLVGKTGSGKTTLAKALLDSTPILSVVVIDPKGTFDYPGVITEDITQLPALAEKNDVLIYRLPPDTDDKNILDIYNNILKWVYDRQNTLLYIDELYGLSVNGITYPPMLRGIYTRGRERGITTLAATQRPKGVPPFCRSENEAFYLFNVGLEDDRKIFARELGDARLISSIDDYLFWHSYKRSKPELLTLEL